MSKGPRIVSSLIANSVEALYCTIELHNKPFLKYRYETCAILLTNAWELILKAYLYQNKDSSMIKYLRNSLKEQKKPIEKRLEDNGEWKTSFSSLVDKVFIGKENKAIIANLKMISKLRNDFAHAYIKELSPVLYSLMCKCIIEYQKFLKLHFGKDLSTSSDLVLLPIGFYKPINIVDYLSGGKGVRTSKIVREIYQICSDLKNDGVEDSILVNFHISMETANKVPNADILVGLSPEGENAIEKITKYKFDPSGQSVSNIPISESEKIFTIPARELRTKITNTGLKIQKGFWDIHKKYKSDDYHGKYWWLNPKTMNMFWSEKGFDNLLKEYKEFCNRKR